VNTAPPPGPSLEAVRVPPSSIAPHALPASIGIAIGDPRYECLATDRIIELEALVRWRHPARGVVPPAEFVPLAEDTGLIVSLGYWVLRKACQQLRRWEAEGLPRR
jgi:hypothetical protein